MIWWPKVVYESLPVTYLLAGFTSLHELPHPLALWPGASFLCAGALVIFMRTQYRRYQARPPRGEELRHLRRVQRKLDREAEAALRDYELSQSHRAERQLSGRFFPSGH